MTEPLRRGTDAAIGERLRTAREQAGISVDQLAAVTRISRTYLLALEEGEFHRLPGPAYVRGFIRLYAGQVGLDPDALLMEFSQQRPADSQGERSGRVKLKGPRLTPGSSRRWLVTGILLVLVLATAYLMDSEEETTPPAVVASTPPPSAPVPVQERMSSAIPPTVPTPPVSPSTMAPAQAPEEAASLPPAEAAPTGGGIFLRIRAGQECWLNIDIDGEMSRQYTLKAGDVIEWKGDRRFSLDIGNAGGIEAVFNGKPLGVLGREGQPLHLELTEEGVQ